MLEECFSQLDEPFPPQPGGRLVPPAPSRCQGDDGGSTHLCCDRERRQPHRESPLPGQARSAAAAHWSWPVRQGRVRRRAPRTDIRACRRQPRSDTVWRLGRWQLHQRRRLPDPVGRGQQPWQPGWPQAPNPPGQRNRSAGAPVGADTQRHEHDEDPSQPGDALPQVRCYRAAQRQRTHRVDHVGDRLMAGERLQPAGHGLDRHKRGADEREREQPDEPERLHRLLVPDGQSGEGGDGVQIASPNTVASTTMATAGSPAHASGRKHRCSLGHVGRLPTNVLTCLIWR